ncbi:MAG: dihydropteroate synthase [Candidatus Omnitrophica bacterium]|nr:dihydropteroate synthase [Candidatus Omnitrophota bacterium]
MEPIKFPPLRVPTDETSTFVLRERSLPLGRRTYLMGVLNVTPDSFSDGGKYFEPEQALHRLHSLIECGADFIDLGGESTRPGASAVSSKEEIHRILPVLQAWKKEWDAILSIDTSKSEVAELAFKQGALLVNDVTGLRGDPRMAKVVAQYGAGLVLMHMRGTPRTMQESPTYENLIPEILEYFEEGIETALRAGVREESILLDPGIGFGKTVAHNLEILRNLREFKKLGRPLLIGTSRKSFIGAVLDLPVDRRLFGTAATVAISVLHGANIVRVHDVAEMKQVVRMADAIRYERKGEWEGSG